MKTRILPLSFILFFSSLQADDAGLVATGAKPVKLAGGFKFTEGPAVDDRGNIFFTDIPNNRIHKWDVEKKEVTTFLENSGGANGLYLSKEGDLYVCMGDKKKVVSLYADNGEEKEPLADQYDGKPFNKPNDLWIHPEGGIYFSDPNYGNKTLSQDGKHLYFITPYHDSVHRVADDLDTPNGVIGTPDGKTLYVADPGAKKTWKYEIESADEGTLANKTLFAEVGSDGMALDNRGNVYLTWGNVLVFSPEGKKLAEIEFPEKPANLCFGGKDGKTLFATARKGFYSFEMAVAGAGFKAQGAPKGDFAEITIACIKEKLMYDTKEFTVRQGQDVTLTFRNNDIPDHNLFIVKPGTAEQVAMKALLMGAEGLAKGYRPETDDILWGTKMLKNGEEEVLRFTAPAPADYQYVCTFPGHGILMRGVMHVVAD